MTDSEDTRAMILKRASDCFANVGFEGASMSEIAAAAGISKGAIYHHFSSKDEIYSEIVITVLRGMYDACSTALANSTDPESKLRIFMHQHAQYFEKHPSEVTVTHFGFRGLKDAPLRSLITQWRDRYEGLLRDILMEGRTRSVFSNFDVSVIGRMILTTLNGMPRWYRPGGRKTATQFADIFCDVILTGLRAPSS
jgi:TetR/AcrR family transcriptional regulator, cholesterol catabolism regulator